MADELFRAELTMRLVMLFGLSKDGRHRILPESIESSRWKSWLGERDTGLRESLKDLYAIALDGEKRLASSRTLRVADIEDPRWGSSPELPLDKALRFLSQPLKVQVENARNDRAFLMAALPVPDRRRLEEAEEKGWLEMDNGGGLPEMRERLEDLKDSGNWRRWELERRFWVFDSDALRPPVVQSDNELKYFPSKPAAQLSRRLRAAYGSDERHHQLRRRAAENYLPPEALLDWAESLPVRQQSDRKKQAREFARWQQDQRSYFHMREGFTKDEKHDDLRKPKVREAVDGLYQSVNRDTLKNGFGPEIRGLFRRPEVLKRPDWFQKDGSHQELASVARRILSLV